MTTTMTTVLTGVLAGTRSLEPEHFIRTKFYGLHDTADRYWYLRAMEKMLEFSSMLLYAPCLYHRNHAEINKTKKHRQSYRHADPRRQWPQVAQRRIGIRNTGHGH